MNKNPESDPKSDPTQSEFMSAQLSRYDELLANIAWRYNLDPSIAAALMSDRAALYFTGSSADQQFPREFAGSIMEMLNVFTQSYVFMYGEQEDPAEAHEGAAEDWVRLFDDSVFHSALEHQAKAGLFRSKATVLVLKCVILQYAPELLGTGVMQEGAIQADWNVDMSEAASGVSVLREEKPPDLSKEALDARFENTMRIVQMTLSTLFLTDLHEASLVRPKQVKALGERCHDSLFTDDLPAKVKMLKDLAMLLRRTNPPQPRAKKILQLQVEKVQKPLEQTHLIQKLFWTLYTQLGYSPPADLQRFEPQVESTPPLREDMRPQALQRSELLGQQAQQLSEPWRLSSKERRQRGFGKLQHALVTGVATEEQQVGGITKEEASEVVSILIRLDVLARQDPRQAQQILQESTAAQQKLQREVELLGIFVQQHAVQGDVSYPKPFQLSEHCAYLRDNWPAIQVVLANHWPQQGRQAAERIRAVLFPDLSQSDDSVII